MMEKVLSAILPGPSLSTLTYTDGKVEFEINYEGTLAKGLPDSLKSGNLILFRCLIPIKFL